MEKNKVLIVDDIPENIETISEMIKDFDIDVKTANGGKEAIELIDSFKPDVILLDLMMPNVNGWDVIDHVRSKCISPLQRPHYFTSSYTYLFSKKVILLSFLG